MNITATLGPASINNSITPELLKKVHRFRLNSGHMNITELRAVLKGIEELFIGSDKTIPVIIDLQGAKVRIGEYIGAEELPDEVHLVNASSSNDASIVPVPDKQFFKALRSKDRLFLNDAKIELEVGHVDTKKIIARVLKNGPLSSHKSINRREHPIHFVKVSDADKKTIGASIKYDFIEYAVSFIHNGEEAKLFRPLVRDKKLVAKIERPECMSHLENIDKNFDELWFCRGDMGSQAGLDRLLDIQAKFVSMFPKLSDTKIIAGRMLMSMVSEAVPTSLETENIVRSKKDGFSGLVLSDETAVGKHPLKVVELVLNIS